MSLAAQLFILSFRQAHFLLTVTSLGFQATLIITHYTVDVLYLFPEFVDVADPDGERPRLYMSESESPLAPSWWRVFLRSPRSGLPRPWKPHR